MPAGSKVRILIGVMWPLTRICGGVPVVMMSPGISVMYCDRWDTIFATEKIIVRGLGYVPEDRRIFTELTVMENLEVGRQPPRRWPDGRTAQALASGVAQFLRGVAAATPRGTAGPAQ